MYEHVQSTRDNALNLVGCLLCSCGGYGTSKGVCVAGRIESLARVAGVTVGGQDVVCEGTK